MAFTLTRLKAMEAGTCCFQDVKGHPAICARQSLVSQQPVIT
jgi:hypothetical protein